MARNQISSALRWHYDEEIFNNAWESELDPTSLALLQSGAMASDSTIASKIAGGMNYYTFPFYKDIEGQEVNYDGNTNIPTDETEDGAQSGIVYGRAKGWNSTTFVNDFTGADPMRNILNRIQKFRAKEQQKRIIGILDAILGINGTGEFADWNNHKMDISSATSTVTDENKISPTTLRDLAVQALGDKADDFALSIMHSQVANTLSKFAVLDYFKFNDARGQELDVRVGRSGNTMVIVCDEVPHVVDGNGNMVYTTYCLGRGVLRYATAPVEKPSEVDRDPSLKGGVDYLYTRYRETVHPNGFTFKLSTGMISPTDAQLTATSNWSIEFNPKNIAIASLKTNG